MKGELLVLSADRIAPVILQSPVLRPEASAAVLALMWSPPVIAVVRPVLRRAEQADQPPGSVYLGSDRHRNTGNSRCRVHSESKRSASAACRSSVTDAHARRGHARWRTTCHTSNTSSALRPRKPRVRLRCGSPRGRSCTSGASTSWRSETTARSWRRSRGRNLHKVPQVSQHVYTIRLSTYPLAPTLAPPVRARVLQVVSQSVPRAEPAVVLVADEAALVIVPRVTGPVTSHYSACRGEAIGDEVSRKRR